MARPEGFEPPTLCLEGRRSFRLSYGRILVFILTLAVASGLFFLACAGRGRAGFELAMHRGTA